LTAILWARIDGPVAILVHLVGKLGGEEDVLALSRVGLEPLACETVSEAS
jgi:hypothetical protein